MPTKPIEWNNEDGTKYKISYSEELQIKNLEATKKQNILLKKHMLLMFGVLLAMVMFGLFILYVFWRLDQFDFFTKVAYR